MGRITKCATGLDPRFIPLEEIANRIRGIPTQEPGPYCKIFYEQKKNERRKP